MVYSMSTTTVGERIRRKRRAVPGFTQSVLSQAVGVSRVHIARIETGARGPSDRLLARIAQALEVPVEELR